MSLHILNRQLSALQPLPVDSSSSACPNGLPALLQQQLDTAIKSSMQLIAMALDRASASTSTPHSSSWAGPAMRRPLVEVSLPGFATMPQVTAFGRPEAAAAAHSQDASCWQPVVQQPLVSLPLAPTPQQLTAEKGKRLLDEANKEAMADGKLSRSERAKLLKVKQQPEVIEYRRQQVDSFKHNYIPSDGGNTPREITRNDALKELYKYSDTLPKKTSLKTLQEIVDGTGSDKHPPQLVAAARYMLDHRDEWKQLTGKDGNDSIKRAGLCNALSRDIQLSPSHFKTLETLERNADDFFDGHRFDREKLQKIVDNPSSKRENVEAAKHLLQDPVLFGMLDNSARGHKSTAWRTSDDGIIGRKDLRSFMEKVNRTPAPEPSEPPRFFSTAADQDAMQAMLKTQENQPPTKTVKGGKAKKIIGGLMKGLSVFYDIGSKALGAVAALKIPLFSQLAAAGSMVTNAYSGALDIAGAAITGGNVKAEAAKAALSFGSNAISVATAPGAGKVLTTVGSEVAKTAAKAAAKEVVKEVGKEVVGEVAQDQAQQFIDDRRAT